MRKTITIISFGLLIALLLTHKLYSDYKSPTVLVEPAVVTIPPVKPIPIETNYRALIAEEFKDAPIMVYIADAESDFLPHRKNPTSSASGLFQITKGTWSDFKCTGDVFNGRDNIKCARKIYNARGTQPWDASKHDWGKHLLP